jgi:hypothetical protein
MEFLEKRSNSGKRKCQKCGGSDLQKLFSTFSAGNSSKSGGNNSCPTGTCPLS